MDGLQLTAQPIKKVLNLMSVFNSVISGNIKSEKELRKVVPHYPKILDKRIIQQLDHYCLEIIEHARLAVIACSEDELPIRILHHSQLSIQDDETIKLILTSPAPTIVSRASLYFLIPGVGHGLRVNGELKVTDSFGELSIKGAYTHCARAAARSNLWLESKQSQIDITDIESFISQSSYLFIKTMNKLGETELSPRGDQLGFVQLINQNTLFIPERPGNKVAISLRNILQNPSVELLMIIPGQTSFLRVSANAELTDHHECLHRAIVNGKRPLLGILLQDCQYERVESDALSKANPWLSENQIDDKRLTRFSKVLSSHMHGEGLLGKATVPIVQTIVNKDLNNLY